VQTATGYDIALKFGATDEYTVWNTDSSGNYISNLIGGVTGESQTLESYETTFNQDLNQDGVIGVPALSGTVIATDTSTYGTTVLTQVGSNYYLNGPSSAGPELYHTGTPVFQGEWGGWAVIGAVQTATGYDIALKFGATDEYTVWNTDSNGNYISNLIGGVTGESQTLQSFEPIFNQDINHDGVTGYYAAAGTTLLINSAISGASGAASIAAIGTLEVDAADSSSVTFNATTGMLKLDAPSTFSGEIFNFAGNGTLSGSDQIDLTNINSGSVHDSYANGVLTVSDGTHTDSLDFNGSYVQANFSFASDGSGGTIVYDPPVSQAPSISAPPPAPSNGTIAASSSSLVTADSGSDTFIFPANFGHSTITNYQPTAETIEFDHASFATSAAVLAALHDDGHGNVVIADPTHDVLTLHNVLAAQLHQNDFVIA
jgi:hypothetical protein